MASPEVLDFATLLEPISGDNPAGIDVRAVDSDTYYQIKDARNTASRFEEQFLVADSSDDQNKPPRPDWGPVLELAPKAIAEKSKNLEITAFLIEALARGHGFAGLRDGFRLARELVEQFWDGLYPLPDEDGLETRVYTFGCLNGYDGDGTLLSAIDRVPITQASSGGDPLATWQYRLGAEEQFERAAGETSSEFFQNLLEDIEQCAEEFQKLSALLDEKSGNASPPSSNIRNALTNCRQTVLAIAKDKVQSSVAEDPGTGTAGPTTAGRGGPAVAVGAIRTRDDAFRTLLQVAEFFRRTEPHTPISYALEQAVRWGRMGLPDLWAELIPEEQTREQLFKLVGIRPPDGPSS